jgi:hypothetical protein
MLEIAMNTIEPRYGTPVKTQERGGPQQNPSGSSRHP